MVQSSSKNSKGHDDTATVVATSAAGGGNVSQARLIGSAVAGVSELAIFHPVDTVAKRLMANETRVLVAGNATLTVSNLNQAVFKDAATKGPISKVGSLFPGIGFGAAYKILQRVYKFGGQPVVRDWVRKHHGHSFDYYFGPSLGKTIASAAAGSLIGIGEVALLPLDALKVKAQTAPEQLKGRGVVDIFVKEGRNLYRGAGWTAARNAPGSFALFGGNAMAKSFMGISESQQATWTQDSIASCCGAVASITVAAPLDVVKTRIQNRPFDSPESGVRIITNMVRNEGFGSFFKGLTPKILVVGPKLVFSFTVAQHMIAYLSNKVDH
jgi:hypothetical protein